VQGLDLKQEFFRQYVVRIFLLTFILFSVFTFLFAWLCFSSEGMMREYIIIGSLPSAEQFDTTTLSDLVSSDDSLGWVKLRELLLPFYLINNLGIMLIFMSVFLYYSFGLSRDIYKITHDIIRSNRGDKGVRSVLAQRSCMTELSRELTLLFEKIDNIRDNSKKGNR